MITINLEGDDRVQQFMAAIRGSAESRLVRKALGVEGRQLIKQHLYDRDKTPNKLGGKRTHFYRQAGDSVTNYKLTASGAVVTVTKEGLRQRYKGGVITPKNAAYLTIPIHPDAHGKRAREFDDLFVVKGVLARTAGEGIEPLFALKKKVSQKADPSVLPTDKAIGAMARQTVFSTVETILKRRGAV